MYKELLNSTTISIGTILKTENKKYWWWYRKWKLLCTIDGVENGAAVVENSIVVPQN